MLATWNPWQEILDLEREMSDLTSRVMGREWSSPATRQGNGRSWNPAVDVLTREGDLVVRVEVPGMDPEKDIDISFQDRVLTIRGERRREQKTDKENYYRFESSYGGFQRSVPVPDGVDPDQIKASYEHGVLEVVVPAAAALPEARRIPVTVREDKKALSTKGEKK
jgi:HSP20 family protein